MLKEIKLINFKIIDTASLIRLQPLTVFIGRNSSGKSSVIESLDWLGRAIYTGVTVATEPFQRISDVIGKWSDDNGHYFEITLKLDPEDISVSGEVVYQVRIGEADDHRPAILSEDLRVVSPGDEDRILIRTVGEMRQRHESVALAGVPNLTRYRQTKYVERKALELDPLRPVQFEPTWPATTDPDRLALTEVDPGKDRAGAVLKEYLERAVFLRLNPRSIATFSPQNLPYSPRLLDDQGYELAALLGTLDAETLDILIEKLSFIIQGASVLASHDPVGPADRRYFELAEARSSDGKNIAIPAWMLSEGTRRITAILAVLLHDEPPPLLCIEEVENGLDPWTLKYLLDELAGAVARGTQVVLTTHSPYLLNLLPLECMILCERNEEAARFLSGADLPELGEIQNRMGPGDLYANRVLHELRK